MPQIYRMAVYAIKGKDKTIVFDPYKVEAASVNPGKKGSNDNTKSQLQNGQGKPKQLVVAGDDAPDENEIGGGTAEVANLGKPAKIPDAKDRKNREGQQNREKQKKQQNAQQQQQQREERPKAGNQARAPPEDRTSSSSSASDSGKSSTTARENRGKPRSEASSTATSLPSQTSEKKSNGLLHQGEVIHAPPGLIPGKPSKAAETSWAAPSKCAKGTPPPPGRSVLTQAPAPWAAPLYVPGLYTVAPQFSAPSPSTFSVSSSSSSAAKISTKSSNFATTITEQQKSTPRPKDKPSNGARGAEYITITLPGNWKGLIEITGGQDEAGSNGSSRISRGKPPTNPGSPTDPSPLLVQPRSLNALSSNKTKSAQDSEIGTKGRTPRKASEIAQDQRPTLRQLIRAATVVSKTSHHSAAWGKAESDWATMPIYVASEPATNDSNTPSSASKKSKTSDKVPVEDVVITTSTKGPSTTAKQNARLGEHNNGSPSKKGSKTSSELSSSKLPNIADHWKEAGVWDEPAPILEKWSPSAPSLHPNDSASQLGSPRSTHSQKWEKVDKQFAASQAGFYSSSKRCAATKKGSNYKKPTVESVHTKELGEGQGAMWTPIVKVSVTRRRVPVSDGGEW